jgi:hypothetical protein
MSLRAKRGNPYDERNTMIEITTGFRPRNDGITEIGEYRSEIKNVIPDQVGNPEVGKWW